MKRLTKALLAALLAFAMVIALAPSEGISAKSVKSQNKQAKKLLYQQVKNKYTRYGYVDIDKDGISELVAKEYSGKFVDGCDKLKSVSIYKVIDGKVQQIFTDSIKGDFYHPSIDCEIYFADTVYVIVKKNHEGYFNQIVYRYAGAETGFTEIASVMEDMAGYGSYVINGVETEYEDFDRKAYDSIVVSYAPYKITFELKDCKVKVANKYLKKMLKSEFNYEAKLGVFDKSIVSPVYDDLNGDGIMEMIVREGPISGFTYYAYYSDYLGDYTTGKSNYTIDDNGSVIYEDSLWGNDEEESEGDAYLGSWQCERCSITIEKEGDCYLFDINWGSSAYETTNWFYYTGYEGETEDGSVKFHSDPHGRRTEIVTDSETGEIKNELVYENGQADFIIENGYMIWNDYVGDTPAIANLKFEKIS